jgi:hypothetical protein
MNIINLHEIIETESNVNNTNMIKKNYIILFLIKIIYLILNNLKKHFQFYSNLLECILIKIYIHKFNIILNKKYTYTFSFFIFPF